MSLARWFVVSASALTAAVLFLVPWPVHLNDIPHFFSAGFAVISTLALLSSPPASGREISLWHTSALIGLPFLMGGLVLLAGRVWMHFDTSNTIGIGIFTLIGMAAAFVIGVCISTVAVFWRLSPGSGREKNGGSDTGTR